jgi:hypothetical protein
LRASCFRKYSLQSRPRGCVQRLCEASE